MTFNVVDAVLQISEALRKVDLEKVPQHVLQVGTEVGRESNLATTYVTLILRCYYHVAMEIVLYARWRHKYLARDDLLINLNGLICEEWRITGGHFIDEHA